MGFPRTNIGAAPAASANGYFASAAMRNGAYTPAANVPTFGARHVTLARTFVSTGDTPGIVTFTGLDPGGSVISEDLIPGASGVTVTGTKFFARVDTIVGSGWVSVAGDDTIVMGWDALNAVAVGAGTLRGIIVNTTAAGAITVTDGAGTVLTLKASIAEGYYGPLDINWSGFLRVEPAAASNITVIHSGSTPSSDALA